MWSNVLHRTEPRAGLAPGLGRIEPRGHGDLEDTSRPEDSGDSGDGGDDGGWMYSMYFPGPTDLRGTVERWHIGSSGWVPMNKLDTRNHGITVSAPLNADNGIVLIDCFDWIG